MFIHLGLGIQPAKKTWRHHTYSLFRNDKEQPLWQFSFVILAPTQRWWASFVLNCILEVTSAGGWRWRIRCTPTLASMCEFNVFVFVFVLRCMCFCKSEWGEKVRGFFPLCSGTKYCVSGISPGLLWTDAIRSHPGREMGTIATDYNVGTHGAPFTELHSSPGLVVLQSLSPVWLFATPWTVAR